MEKKKKVKDISDYNAGRRMKGGKGKGRRTNLYSKKIKQE